MTKQRCDGCRSVGRALVAGALAAIAGTGSAHAASVTNTDGEPQTIIITEQGVRSELVVGANETLQFCTQGCFVTMPNGDRAVLRGTENLAIVGGEAIIN